MVLAVVGIVGMQALPTVLEYQKINAAVQRAVRDGADVAAIRTAFDKASVVDDIKSLDSKDLVFKKIKDDRYEVSFAYNKEIAIYKPVYLLIKYSGTVSK
jgi:hypothetical protein